MTGLEAYAIDSAVTLWGTAFNEAISEAARDAKNHDQAQSRAMQVVRRWVPSTRKYR